MHTHPAISVSKIDLQRLTEMLHPARDSNSPTLNGLREELARATVVGPREVPPTVVTMNSKVKFAIQPTGKVFELTLVYPQDMADHRPDLIAVTAPIGSALLGLSVGQTIEWPLPGGHTTSVKVIEITYQPEREGHFHL